MLLDDPTMSDPFADSIDMLRILLSTYIIIIIIIIIFIIVVIVTATALVLTFLFTGRDAAIIVNIALKQKSRSSELFSHTVQSAITATAELLVMH